MFSQDPSGTEGKLQPVESELACRLNASRSPSLLCSCTGCTQLRNGLWSYFFWCFGAETLAPRAGLRSSSSMPSHITDATSRQRGGVNPPLLTYLRDMSCEYLTTVNISLAPRSVFARSFLSQARSVWQALEVCPTCVKCECFTDATGDGVCALSSFRAGRVLPAGAVRPAAAVGVGGRVFLQRRDCQAVPDHRRRRGRARTKGKRNKERLCDFDGDAACASW